MDVPVQYFQSVIAIELAVSGALLWQMRFFESNTARRQGEPLPDAAPVFSCCSTSSRRFADQRSTTGRRSRPTSTSPGRGCFRPGLCDHLVVLVVLDDDDLRPRLLLLGFVDADYVRAAVRRRPSMRSLLGTRSFILGAGEVLVDELHRFLLVARHQVPVAVERDLDRRVPDVGRERLRVDARRDEEARARVSEFVQPDRRQARRRPRLRRPDRVRSAC
jgi:hypothetical protein